MKMKQNTSNISLYASPEIKIVSIHIEKGFAASPSLEGDIEDMPWG